MRLGVAWGKSDWEHRGLCGEKRKGVAFGIKGENLRLPCRAQETSLKPWGGVE